jgi:Uma2 family endonuclease
VAKAVTLLTAEDLERLGSDCRCELIDGVLVEMPPVGGPHARITTTLIVLLHPVAHVLGELYTELGCILARNPDRVRAPDVAFIRMERIPPEGEPRGFWEIAPDLVVEVVSPNDTPAEIQLKVREWIEAGVRLVWVVYPDTRTVSVVRSLLDREELTSDDTLDGGEVLPGFSCRVAEVFA